MRQWRLIYDQPMSGARNMAVDEAILAGNGLPTLRLYRWALPCLSLGYGQRAREADITRLAERGWEIVRRPTGGRAILHGDEREELTYSLALPADHALARESVIESYRQISQALIAVLKRLGAEPSAERSEGKAVISPVCFETPSHYEITVGGRKLIGSAQMRRRQGLLQHGTLPLAGDIARICDGLVYADEKARSTTKAEVRAHAITLAEALGKSVDWQSAADAIAEGFREAFGITLIEGTLTSDEEAHAERLTQEVYGSEKWTFRR